jgi:hypothetical protein
MALSNFLSKLNWRLMVVHFIACWFIYHAFWQLGYLYDYNYMEKVMHQISFKGHQMKINNYQGLDGYRMGMISVNALLISFGSLLLSFVISLLLSLKHKWYWVNSVVVLLTTITIFGLNRFYWDYLRPVFQAPGRLFKSDWAFILTNGVVMLVIGLALFFWKRIIRFINGAKTRPAEGI